MNRKFVELPKVVKQNYYINREFNPSHYPTGVVKRTVIDDEEEEVDEEDEENSEEDEEDSEEDEEEDENINLSVPRVAIVQKSPFTSTPLSTGVSGSGWTESSQSLNKMTLDLMMNPQYLSKANPEAFQKKIEQAQRILKHKRDIQKTLDDCFDALSRLVHRHDTANEVDLDIQTGFLHFAKTVLFNLQQQQDVGKSDTKPIFSECQDIHSSSFYPDTDNH